MSGAVLEGGGPVKVTQTIMASDPKREGNCLSACVATFFGLTLEQVPHFIELGAQMDSESDEPDTTCWWSMWLGFMAGYACLWPMRLESIHDGLPGEVLFVMGMSPRGVCHQVLYRDGELWHDPHPSRDGITDVREVLAWRLGTHDHTPTAAEPAAALPPDHAYDTAAEMKAANEALLRGGGVLP